MTINSGREGSGRGKGSEPVWSLRSGGRASEPLGLYIHIPFCARKCHYCDFRSFGEASEEERERYVTALCGEIQEYKNEVGRKSDEIDINQYYVDSIFFGGGTPSLLSGEQIRRVLCALRDVFSVTAKAEITVEANPGTLDADKLRCYREMGINRLSMGVQSLDDGVLRTLGRIHDRETAVRNFAQAREAGFDNINLDLMFGIPGQNFEVWERTLAEVLTLEPEHLSFYSLQIEEGTPFYEWFAAGKLEQPSEELDRRMYHQGLGMIAKKGYRHYEISNAARDGYFCRHNLKYWSMEDYLGLGLSAHSYVRGVRFFNTGDMDAYLSGERLANAHRNDRGDSISDYLFTGLRRIEGISLENFELRFGQSLFDLFGAELRRFVEEGLVAIDGGEGGRLRFTERGLDFTNTVLRELMTAGGVHE